MPVYYVYARPHTGLPFLQQVIRCTLIPFIAAKQGVKHNGDPCSAPLLDLYCNSLQASQTTTKSKALIHKPTRLNSVAMAGSHGSHVKLSRLNVYV
jgi:hypothetical protein